MFLERDDILVECQNSDSAVFCPLGFVHEHHPDRHHRRDLGHKRRGSDKAHDIVTRNTRLREVFEAMRRFAGVELGDDRIPDETTILNFRHLLERYRLTEAIFAEVSAHLADKGITLRSGTLVDATIIDAPSSTKNKAKARDPEMSSTKKGNDWYFGSEAD